MVIVGKTTLNKAHRGIIFIGLMFCITLLMCNFASAGIDKSFTKDNEKASEKTNYGTIKLVESKWYDIFGWTDDKVKDITLKSNTESCSNNCEEIHEQVLYKDGILIEDSRYWRIYENGSRKLGNIRSEKFFIQDGTEISVEPIMEWTCKDNGKINKNGTKEQYCENKRVGLKQVETPIWKEYEIGTSVKAGNYTIKHIGEKRADWTYDWEFKTNGVWTSEWAVWGGQSIMEGLLGYWTFNESSGTTAYDSTPYGTTMSGDMGNWVNGKIGNAGYFIRANSNDLINTSISTRYASTQTEGTMSTWVRFNSTPVYQMIIQGANGEGSAGESWILTINDPSSSLVAKSNDLSVVMPTPPINVWMHIAMVWNSTGMYLYKNGTLYGSDTTGTLSLNPVNTLIFGKRGDNNHYFDGSLDETAIWNRTLSASEISQLYNNNIGLTYSSFIGSSVTLNSPINHYNSSSSIVEFNCSANVVGANLTNISLYTNKTGSWTIANTTTSNGAIMTSSFSDGSWLWSCGACDSDGDCGFASTNRTLTIDTTAPTISILYPTGTINYGYVGQNISLNYSISDASINTCWFEYNGINTTIPCASNSTMILNTSKTLTLYANDTFGNTNYSVASWDYSIFENSQTYNTETYETANEDFYLNLTYNSSASAISVKLNYNNTNYSTINLGSGNNGYFKASLPIPLTNSEINKTFFWFIITNSTTTTDGTNQTVKPIILSFCNATYTTKTLNFTLYDETTRAVINATSNTTSFESTFYYWYGDGSLKKMYPYQNLSSNNNNFNFCISPNITLKTDFTLSYTATDYVDRTYNFLNLSINNVSQPISLYLLQENLGTKFFHSIRKGVDIVPNVLVKIDKFIVGEGLFKEIGIRKSDIDGKFVEWLEQDKEYNYTILSGINNGVSIEKNALCSISPCEINLQIEGDSDNVFEELDAYLASYVNYSLTFNKTSKIVTLNFEDLLGTAQYWRLYVYKPYFDNDTRDTICDVYSYSVSGVLTCNTSDYLGDLEARVYISRSPEKLVDFLKFLNEDITDTLGITGLFASIIILLVLIFTGTRSPTNAMIMLPFGLTILKFLGFLPLGWGTIMAIVVVDLILLSKMMKG